MQETKLLTIEDSRTIDTIKVILIVLVVLLHTNLIPDSGVHDTTYTNFSSLFENILLLSNPGFFLISGFLYFYKGDFSIATYKVKQSKRIHTLLIPYLLWNTIYIIIYSIGYCFLPELAGTEKITLQQMNVGDFFQAYIGLYGDILNSFPIDGPLWFVRDLMVLTILSLPFYYIIKVHKLSILVAPLPLFIIPNSTHSVAFTYFFIGCWLAIWRINLMDIVKAYWKWSMVIFTFAMFAQQHFTDNNFIDIALSIIATTSGLVVLSRLGIAISNKIGDKVFIFLKESIFCVFALHGIIARFLTKITAHILIEIDAPSLTYFTAHICNAIAAILLCLLAFYILKKISPKFCILLGCRI